MPNNKIQSLTVSGVTYDIVDNTSGYAKTDSPAFTGTPTAPTASSGDSSTQIATTAFVQDAMSGAGAGTVTSVAVANDTNGGLSVSGSPITSSGTIKVGHSNVLTNAQTTSGVYPIKIDKNGHISEYGSVVTSMPASDVSAWAKEATKPTYTYSEVGAAASSHTHGNITNGGDITATAPTIASGDQIIINDNSESKITNGPTFDGTTTTKALTQKGTWETFLQSESDPVFSASAAAGITSSDITNWNGKTSNTGTVTSVRVQATSPVQSSTSTEQTTSLNTTISLADAYGDTKNPYGTKTAKYVLAGPTSGSAAAPSFRALVASDIPDLSSTYLTSESDPIFSASAAAGITSTDISNWNSIVSDDHKWNDVSLNKTIYANATYYLLPFLTTNTDTQADLVAATATPTAKSIAVYDANAYLVSTTPSAGDNSTKVATTAYVDKVATQNNTGVVKPWYYHSAGSTGPTAGSNNIAVAVNSITTTAGKYYAVESDVNGRLFVNVPWANTTYTTSTTTVGSASAGTAISADDITAWDAGSLPSLGNAIKAYTGLTTGDSVSVTAGTAASASFTSGTFSQGSLPTLSLSCSNKTLSIDFGQGTLPSHGADSFSFSANTPTSVTKKTVVTGGTTTDVPNVTGVGSLPSLSYTSRSIPNISVTDKTVVTDIVSS